MEKKTNNTISGNPDGKLRPEDKDSTYLHEFSFMNNTYFCVIHCVIHLDMKLDYTISGIASSSDIYAQDYNRYFKDIKII